VVAEAACKRRSTGSSLVEILAVIAIIVAVAGLFLPVITGAGGRVSIDAEARHLGRTLRVAQARAIARHASVTVHADIDTDTVTIVEDNLVEKLRADLASVDPADNLVYGADGGPSAAKSYTLSDADGNVRTVQVAAGTGHVSYGP
jgi:type II secretory pathway pseudopilin PulG